MSYTKLPKAYERFKNYMKKHNYKVLCAWNGCNEIMRLKSYQNHCKTRHGLDHLTCCVFCEGKTNWPQKQKLQMGEHLYQCVLRFVRLFNQNPPTREILPVLPDQINVQLLNEPILPVLPDPINLQVPNESSLCCSKRCFEFCTFPNGMTFKSKWNDHDWNEAGVRFMEEPLFQSNPERLDFTESDVMRRMSLEMKPEDKKKWLALLNPLKFDHRSGLGQAHLWIKRFLYSSWTPNHYTWYHLCVRAGCMKSFVEAMEDLDVVAVPNWCVCDGGLGFDDPTLQARTHHRHLILAVKNQKEFHKVLETKIEYRASGESPEPGFKKYYSKLIQDGNHFVNSLVYVSLPSSKCRCKQMFKNSKVPFLDFVKRRRLRHEGHYFVSNNVPLHARWWLMLLIPDGGLDRYARFSIGSRNVYGMKSRRRVSKRWMLSAEDEFDVKNCVVKFDPPNLRIDTEHPIEDLESYVESRFESKFDVSPYDGKNPFVYWFDDKMYPVRLMHLPKFDDDETLQEWYVSNKINTLLNLGDCGSWFRMSRNLVRHANALVALKKDCDKVMSDEICKLRKIYDEEVLTLQLENNKLRNEAQD